MDSRRKSGRYSVLGVVGFAIFFATIYFSFFDLLDSFKSMKSARTISKQELGRNRNIASTQPTPADDFKKMSASENITLLDKNVEADQEEKKREEHKRFRQQIDDCNARIKEQRESEVDFLKRLRPKLEDKIGSWIFDPDWKGMLPKNETKVEGKFLLALAYAGLLEGLPKNLIYQDYDVAKKMLVEVHNLVPKNSAPLLYLAAIEKKLGNLNKSINLKQSAFSTTYFDSYEKTIGKSFMDLINTTSDMSVAFDFWVNAPIPDFIVLRELLSSQEDSFFADQMLKESLNPANLLDGYDWSFIRHQFGRAIRKKTTGQEDIISAFELVKMKFVSRGIRWVDSEEGTKDYLRSCDLSHFEDHLALLKQHRESKRNN